LCYYNGEGVDRDFKEAARCFRLAADQKDVETQCNLGVCYEREEGLKQSREDAVRHYRLAADQGEISL
jgi:uncharacterized protein